MRSYNPSKLSSKSRVCGRRSREIQLMSGVNWWQISTVIFSCCEITRHISTYWKGWWLDCAIDVQSNLKLWPQNLMLDPYNYSVTNLDVWLKDPAWEFILGPTVFSIIHQLITYTNNDINHYCTTKQISKAHIF